MRLSLNRYLCLITLCALSVNNCLALVSPSLSKPNYFHALWKGVITQPGNSPYSVIIDISANRYRVNYDSLNCDGHLDLIEKSENKLIFQEILIIGESSCTSGGKVILRKSGPGKVSYEWVGRDNKAKATGVLFNHKRQPARSEACKNKTADSICM